MRDMDKRDCEFLASVVAAHLPEWEGTYPKECLDALSDHARDGCMCDFEAIRTGLGALRHQDLPIPDVTPRALTLAMSNDDAELYIVTARQLKGEGFAWRMPDLMSALAVACCVVHPSRVVAQTGKPDVVASLLFGWERVSIPEWTEIGGEIWEGPFPEDPESVAITSLYFDGDYSAPAGGVSITLHKLAGRYWACQNVTGEKTWDAMRGRTRAEALAEFEESYAEPDDYDEL